MSEESFREAQVAPAEQEKWKNAIADYERQTLELSTLVQEVNRSISDRMTNEEVLEQCRQAKHFADAKVQQASSQRAELSAEMKVASDRQQQAKQLLEEQSKLAEQEQIDHTLSRNLKSDEFQGYILENLQAELVACATELLKELTDSRYALRIQDGEYWVEGKKQYGHSPFTHKVGIWKCVPQFVHFVNKCNLWRSHPSLSLNCHSIR